MNPQEQHNDPTGQNPPVTNPGQIDPQTYQPQNPQSTPRVPSSPDGEPQVVYMARPVEPHRQTLSPEFQKRHEDSVKQYPRLNLSGGEYIISAIKRHPIGLFPVWISTALVILAIVAIVAFLVAKADANGHLVGTSMPATYLAIPALLISILALLFAFVGTIVYNANRFYLTNESVIQHIQTSLFSQREQTISLSNIEDASFNQDGILPHIFNYGLLRLSTQGDETTYRFTYASSPEKQIALLNNAVEDFKNVRPMEG